MKKTYKLLGVIWDHDPLPQTCPVFVQGIKADDWREERNLFDLQQYARKISFIELLSLESKSTLYNMLDSVKGCDSIYIMLDYEPVTNAEAAISFYALRLLQIYENIKRSLPNIPICIVGSDRIRSACERLLLE